MARWARLSAAEAVAGWWREVFACFVVTLLFVLPVSIAVHDITAGLGWGSNVID